MSEATGKLESAPFRDLNVTKKIAHNAGIWIFRAHGLFFPAPAGITTMLGKETSEYGDSIWVDWPDILNHPEEVRINILVSRFSEKDPKLVPFEKRFQRTGDILESVQIYNNDLMVEDRQAYGKEDIERMLKVPRLPRPKIALIDADREGLDNYFKSFPQVKKGEGSYAGAYRIPWDKLVELAKEGHLPLF